MPDVAHEGFYIGEELADLAYMLHLHVPAQVGPGNFAECSCGEESLTGYEGLLDHIVSATRKEGTHAHPDAGEPSG